MNDAAANLQPTPAPPRGRIWLFRAIAVLLGLAPLVAFEGLCRLCDWGRAEVHDDPFVGFRSVRPLFVLSDDGLRYEIPKSRQWYFRPQSFEAKKPAGEFRIFCIGASTVQGEPFDVETSFPTWLEIELAAADPSHAWKVVNCGGVSYATYRLVPILQEVLRYEPDLVIFYEGQNEFLESRTFDHIRSRGEVVNAAVDMAAHLRTFTLAREGYLRLQGISSSDPPRRRPILPTEVEALLDYRGGLEEYHRDEAWRSGVIAHFRFNLQRIVQLTREAGVRLILMNPVANLSDSPPFKSEHGAGLSAAQLEEWDALCEAAREQLHGERRDVQRAIRLLEQACELDPLHAGCFYNLAKCYEAAGQFEQAKAAYIEAKELDVCPLRILEPMNDAVLEVAELSETPLVDARRLFEERSEHGIVGGRWLVDHVHPGVEGHQLLADAVAEKMIELGWVAPIDDWQRLKMERFREHYESLDNLYFLRGKARLDRLRGWAHGRVTRRRDPSKETAPGGPARGEDEVRASAK